RAPTRPEARGVRADAGGCAAVAGARGAGRLGSRLESASTPMTQADEPEARPGSPRLRYLVPVLITVPHMAHLTPDELDEVILALLTGRALTAEERRALMFDLVALRRVVRHAARE